MLWLEEEGARQRRKASLPPEVGYAAWYGRVQVGACVLSGALAAGLFVSWLGVAGHLAYRVGVLGGSTRASAGMTLAGARVVGIARAAKPGGGAAPVTLLVRHGGVLIPCEFRAESAPREVRVGDVVSIWSRAGREEERTASVLLKDCELVLRPRPGE
jgi:hypothetical protein